MYIFWEINLKKKNSLIKSLIAPCLLIIIEQKKHKTKELKNKSTIDDETFISSKETSKIIWFINYSMASESFHIIESIDFHVNKLAPENDTSESKKPRSTSNSLWGQIFNHTSSC